MVPERLCENFYPLILLQRELVESQGVGAESLCESCSPSISKGDGGVAREIEGEEGFLLSLAGGRATRFLEL